MGCNDTLLGITSDDLVSYLNTNLVGPNRVIKAFLPALLAATMRKIIVISSTSGSNELQRGSHVGFNGPYAVSKAALNMLAVQYHMSSRTRASPLFRSIQDGLQLTWGISLARVE